MPDEAVQFRARVRRLLIPLLVYLGIIAAVVVYTRTRPKLYESTAVVQDAGYAGGEKKMKLSDLTAALAAEDAFAVGRWDVTEEEARKRVRKASRLELASDGTTTIRVRHVRFFDCRDLAKSIAATYQGARAEEARRKAPVGIVELIHHPSDAADNREVFEALEDLEWLFLALQEQAHAAGFRSFGQIEAAQKDSEKARALLADEDFVRRHAKLRELRSKVESAYPEITPELRVVAYPPLPRIDNEPPSRGFNSFRSDLVFQPPEPVKQNHWILHLVAQGVALFLAVGLFILLRPRTAAADD